MHQTEPKGELGLRNIMYKQMSDILPSPISRSPLCLPREQDICQGGDCQKKKNHSPSLNKNGFEYSFWWWKDLGLLFLFNIMVFTYTLENSCYFVCTHILFCHLFSLLKKLFSHTWGCYSVLCTIVLPSFSTWTLADDCSEGNCDLFFSVSFLATLSVNHLGSCQTLNYKTGALKFWVNPSILFFGVAGMKVFSLALLCLLNAVNEAKVFEKCELARVMRQYRLAGYNRQSLRNCEFTFPYSLFLQFHGL